jgi:hypothetical protein
MKIYEYYCPDCHKPFWVKDEISEVDCPYDNCDRTGSVELVNCQQSNTTRYILTINYCQADPIDKAIERVKVDIRGIHT